ncbi:GNAT family N-acetyltransferase [Streptomyces sp. NPDC096040]|uniref:GNAT family N-acetyltransferase n=1 Tax=Streptomyces sp. NPDC096040 TaxID=3155541 RepID=UPI00331F8148
MTSGKQMPWDLISPKDGRSLWLSARILSGDPHQRWTFSRFLHRSMVSAEPGLSWVYEELYTWAKVKRALIIGESLQKQAPAFPQMSVGLGMGVFESALRSRTGRFKSHTDEDKFIGRHSVPVAKWKSDTDDLVIVNNWGKRWGDGGTGYIDREYFDGYVDSAILLRPSWIGPSPEMAAAEKRQSPSASMSDYVKCWLTGNKHHRLPEEYSGGHTHSAYRVIETFDNRQPLIIAEIRDKDKEFHGRVHVSYDRRDHLCSILELWVPPRHRRQGYGQRLEAFARAIAADAGAEAIAIPVHEADGGQESLSRAQAFTSSLGYSWEVFEPYRYFRPNLVACAMKSLN